MHWQTLYSYNYFIFKSCQASNGNSINFENLFMPLKKHILYDA